MSDELFDDFEILHQVVSDVPEHQFLISFTNDEDCALFHHWWSLRGRRLFNEYLNDPKI